MVAKMNTIFEHLFLYAQDGSSDEKLHLCLTERLILLTSASPVGFQCIKIDVSGTIFILDPTIRRKPWFLFGKKDSPYDAIHQALDSFLENECFTEGKFTVTVESGTITIEKISLQQKPSSQLPHDGDIEDEGHQRPRKKSRKDKSEPSKKHQ